jgi:hypothetical protein
MIKGGKNLDNSGFPAFTFITFRNNPKTLSDDINQETYHLTG